MDAPMAEAAFAMTRHTQRRIKTAARMMMVCVPVALTYELIDSGVISGVGLAIGIALAMPLVLLEESGFDRRIERLPFSTALVAKALAYVASLAAVFMCASFVVGYSKGLTISDFRESLLGPDFRRQLAAGFAGYVVIVFFRQLDRLLGPGVLLRYVLGRYHQPRREARIFMFLDLKSSTSLAEKLGPEAYYSLVNECFRDLATPVLDSSGEIYEYVGDEVVLTWTVDRGVRDANCIRVFFDFAARIDQKRQTYMDRFGVVPEFKAGVHVGEVMTAEIGDLKKALVFNGDVLNVGSRIEGQCNQLGKRLLASSELVERLEVSPEWLAEDMGEVRLRGKKEPLRLVAFA
jgi:adenylate cyclase